MDMARNMGLASENSFPNAKRAIDRFHVVRLVMDTIQHMRVSLRWDAIEQENTDLKNAIEKGEKYFPEVLSNGDTINELLVRSMYLLYKYQDDRTLNQKKSSYTI